MRFFKEVKKYASYMYYAAYANLKAQVAGSYLNWVWWLLEPLGMMIVYSVIFGWLFKQGIQYFPVFIFIGNTIWGFFNRVSISSVSLIKQNEALISRIYIPKFILLVIEMFINGFKLLIQFGLTIVLMLIYRVPVSIHVLWIIPILVTLFLVTFGICSIIMNWGVFLEDLEHAMSILLTVWMYFSGIFYDFKTMVPEPTASIAIVVNPIAYLIIAMRDALMYSRAPQLTVLAGWFVAGLVLSTLGLHAIYKNENGYVKRI